MVGLAVSGMVTAGVVLLMGQLGSTQRANQIQTLINSTHFLGVQIINNPALFADRMVMGNPLGLSPDLKACLAATGVDCPNLPKKFPLKAADARPVPATVNDALNAGFGFNGPCASADPTCLVKRTTTYYWSCPQPTYCTGLNILTRTEQLRALATDARVLAREGSAFIPARQFQSKGQVTFGCADSGQGIFSVNYLGAKDNCTTFPATLCQMPVVGYAVSKTCHEDQTKSCADGYAAAGLFDDQKSCISSATFTPSTPPVTPPPPTLKWITLSSVAGTTPTGPLGVPSVADANGRPCFRTGSTGPDEEIVRGNTPTSTCPGANYDGYPCTNAGHRCYFALSDGTWDHCRPTVCGDSSVCPGGNPAQADGTCAGQSGNWEPVLPSWYPNYNSFPACPFAAYGVYAVPNPCSPVNTYCKYGAQFAGPAAMKCTPASL